MISTMTTTNTTITAATTYADWTPFEDLSSWLGSVATIIYRNNKTNKQTTKTLETRYLKTNSYIGLDLLRKKGNKTRLLHVDHNQLDT